MAWRGHGFCENVPLPAAGQTTEDDTMQRKDRRLHAWVVVIMSAWSAHCWVIPVQAQTGSTDAGQKIFMQNNCFVCHGQQGFGGIGPAFRNDPFLLLTEFVACQILLGRGAMPPFGGKLDDNQIAAVASYVRNSWGNHFGVVKPEEVTKVREMVETFRQQTASPAPPTPGIPR
jgi:mono/diheme cytochrome c family protein